jgi:hypothetical protein
MTKDIYNKCRSLSFRQNGLMSLYLSNARFNKTQENCDCYIIMEDNILLSWAIVYRTEVHYYTRKTYRKKGLGSLLAKKIHKDYKESSLISGVYDSKSENFYQKYKYKRINFKDE